MQKPAVVVFDLGKVLVDFDYSIAAAKLGPVSTMRADEMQYLLCRSPLLCQYETGQIDTAEFHRQVTLASGLKMELEEFCLTFGDIFAEIPEMIRLQATLRRAGVPTWILSNTNEIAVRHIRQRFPFFGNFDGYILSYEHGSMKPDAKIYEVTERMTGRRGAEILYLDDRPENVEGGAARHWRAIMHADPAHTIAQVKATGLPVE